ncbi:TPA: Alw26I/Eco31I/Esp3I family type II restriction endonuclease, partial [Escherichia coli]
RIAFTSLNDYHRKENRNAFIVSNELSEKFFSEAMDNLKSLSEITSCLDEKISGIISENSDSKNEFRTIITDLREIVTNNKEKFNLILKYLISGMSEIGKELESYWENDRYVRSIPEEFIE